MKATVTPKHRAFSIPAAGTNFQLMVNKVLSTLPKNAPDTVLLRPEAKVIIFDTRFISTLLWSHAQAKLRDMNATEVNAAHYW
jgi:hypothetical protein